jgi:hypothetical protein
LGAFNFIAALAAVINGLGIVRWLNTLADFLKRKDSMAVEYYWVFGFAGAFQFILHVLFWWSLWSIRDAGGLTFVSYLYMLIGPILLFLGSAFLVPDIEGDRLNLKQHYYAARPVYSTLLVLVWAWASLASLVFRRTVTDAIPVLLSFLLIALVQRLVAGEFVQRATVILNWLVLLVFILSFASELGGLSPLIHLDS